MHRANVMYNIACKSSLNLECEKREKEAIHSGQFMVSHFEAEAQDDEDDLAVPVPEVAEIKNEFEIVPIKTNDKQHERPNTCRKLIIRPQIGIDTSLAKLFQCMSLAYRQKLTSPKWNRFRGIRLRWKDKIRLNNVIWRCWHMQFIKKQNTLICQFASPLDVDTHNKPEAVVLEGKYWKRKLAAVTAEYKKWRMFYRNQVMGHNKDATDALELELLSWNSQAIDENMLVDEDYMGLMSDTLFSTITNQPFPFPDTREIAKAGLADFIQPSLGPLQPNLDDYMDTFEPLQDFICGRLAPVPEEHSADNPYKHDFWYSDYGAIAAANLPPSIPVHPPVNLPIESYPMQPPQSAPQMVIKPQIEPQLEAVASKYSHQTVSNYNEAGNMFNAMISKQQPSKPSMDLVPVPTKQFTKPMYMGGLDITSNLCVVNNTQIHQDIQDLNRLPPTQTQSYKFSQPSLPNIKFTSQPTASSTFTSATLTLDRLDSNKKEEKVITPKPRNATRGRPRSRSNTRETIKKPPLLSAVSDPSLITSSNSALLTQLLKTNNDASSTLNTNQRVIMPLERKPYVRVKEENVPIPILPQPTPTTLILTPVVNMAAIRPALNIEPIMLNTMNTASNTSSPGISDSCLNSPTPSQESMGSPTTESNRDQRRAGHIHAEQKRRYNIKNGFDMIHSLIPQLNQNPNAKLSKAAMLQKGAEYIKQLRTERNMLKDEMDNLRQQIETLNTSISNCQSLLPATGAPVSRRRDNKLQEMFDDYVRTRTMEDWKFWIFSLLFRPLLTSFNNVVSTTSMDDLYRSTMLWIEQHCTLGDLRPIVLNSLRYLCTKTDILSEPERLPDEARQMVQSNQNHPAPMP